MGRPLPKNRAQDVEYNAVTPGALRALRVHLLRGRLLDEGDTEHAAPVAIVTRAFVHQNFPTEDPIGRRIVIAYGTNPPWGRRIVGVVDDFKMESLTEAPMAQVVVPFYQDVMPMFQVVARTRASTAQVSERCRRPSTRSIVRFRRLARTRMLPLSPVSARARRPLR